MKLSEIQIELCGVCNAACTYCTWDKRTTGKQIMDTGLAIGLVLECARLGIKTTRLHGVGESTLHPDLVQIANEAAVCNIGPSLSTNCYKLKDAIADGLRQIERLELILAVPWVMPDKFVDQCVTNALDYLTQGSANHRIKVQMVCHRDAERFYDRLVDTFLPFIERRNNAVLHLKQPVTWPNDTPNPGFIRFDLANHPKVEFDRRATPLSLGVGCDMPERFLMVQADGRVSPCCVGVDDWGLGKINYSSGAVVTLEYVWSSPPMAALRNLWRSKDTAIPCGHCQSRTDVLQHVVELGGVS